MNVIPEGVTGGQVLKRALVIVVVLAVLIVGSWILVDLGSTDRVTVTFEGDEREHVSGFDFKHRTVDARSGDTVITNSRDGVSRTNRSLKILFHEPKEQVQFYAGSPSNDAVSARAFALDRNMERTGAETFGGVDFREWARLSFGGPIRGIEVFVRDRDGLRVAVWVDDISFQGPPPPISGATQLTGLAALWIAGLATLFVVTGLFGRLRAGFTDGGREGSDLVIDDVPEEGGDRYVVLRNVGTETVDLSEASLTDGTGNQFQFGKDVAIKPGQTETFHVHDAFADDTDSTFTLTTKNGEEYEIR